jgi:hypothetical protein
VSRSGLAALLLFLALVAVVFADPLLIGREFLRRDMGIFFAPGEQVVHRAWAAGRLPLWWDEISGGKPLLPNPNAGALYPARVVGALLPFALYFKLYPIFHLALAGAGLFLLLRRWRRSPEAAFAGAVVYAFCGPAMSLIFAVDFIAGYALMPWIVLAAARLAERPTASRAAPLALLIALALLAGDIITLGLALSGALLVVLDEAGPARRAALGRLAAASAVGVLAAGVQVVPTLLWVPETGRALGRLSIADAFHWTLHPLRLAEWILPYPFGRTETLSVLQTWGGRFFDHRPVGYFATLFAGTVGAVGLAREFWPARSDRLRSPRSMRMFFLAATALAMAPLLLPNRHSGAPSPLPLRYPEKLVLGSLLAMAVFAGFEWDRRRQERARPALPWIFAAILAAAAGAAAALAPGIGPGVVRWTGANPAAAPAVARFFPLLLLAGAGHWILGGTALHLRARSAAVSWQILALALLAGDLLLATRRIAASSPEAPILEAPPVARWLAKDDPAARFFHLDLFGYDSAAITREGKRTPEEFVEGRAREMRLYCGSLWKRPTIFNIDSDLSDLYRMDAVRRLFEERLASAGAAPGRLLEFLAGFSVRYLLHDPREALAGTRPAAVFGSVAVDEVPAAVPRLRLATRWTELPTALTVWNRMRSAESPPDLALLETGRSSSGEARPGHLRLFAENSNGFIAEASCPDATWLLVARSYWRWREVRVDGIRVDAVPERFALSAVAVPAGRHRIVWRELDPGGATGPAASAAGLLLIGLGIVRRARQGEVS